MKRKIIRIDEELCNGCGDCTTGCSEGALQIIDGKAKLVKEDFCDGFGDCIGTCPTGALTIEEREAPAFDENATKDHLFKTQGADAVKKMEEAQQKHQPAPSSGGGCPGMRSSQGDGGKLKQWPIQLHLVGSTNPAFINKELAIISTCSPVASSNMNSYYTKNRGIVMACPKLDRTEPYVDKLAAIFAEANTPKAIILRMEVPCCGGLTQITKQAAAKSGRTDLIVEEHTLGIDGTIKQISIIEY